MEENTRRVRWAALGMPVAACVVSLPRGWCENRVQERGGTGALPLLLPPPAPHPSASPAQGTMELCASICAPELCSDHSAHTIV